MFLSCWTSHLFFRASLPRLSVSHRMCCAPQPNPAYYRISAYLFFNNRKRQIYTIEVVFDIYLWVFKADKIKNIFCRTSPARVVIGREAGVKRQRWVGGA